MTVALTGLRCTYGRAATPVVDIDELLLTGGVCGLVGVNGAGKSTLLRTLAGCRRPDAGAVRVDDVDLYRRSRGAVIGRIGYMPQQLDLPRELRVSDALAYASWVRGVPAALAARRNAGILDRVGLGSRRDDRVGRLSGGMNRRLALAVALVTEPDVLLLDEPTTGLDPEQRAALRAILLDLDASAVTVLSSHVMEDVAQMADRVAVIEAGRVLYDGGLDQFVAERGGPGASAEHAFLATIAGSRS
ncbi:ABC transporter ATP-binding protein [Pimelobacter simplex]|uniref:ABC transporter ATP-binding protein n=1 Tax=Nocardioides simplex TaxID=2045 RepID=UPI003AAD85C0